MDVFLDDFRKDLSRLRKLLALIGHQRSFRVETKPAQIASGFIERAAQVHDSVNECHADLVVLSGAMVLYLGGRFEFYVRERFEQACDNIASKCASIKDLPTAMRENLVKLTAEVMSSPRKYGHGEKGVEAFVKSLAENMSETAGLKNINRQCLSITSENMRPDILGDLFGRIGLKEIWRTIAEQAYVRLHFGQTQVDKTQKCCRDFLNDFMDVRNTIAHPSSNVQWPDTSKVEEYIEYFDGVTRAISEVVAMHEASFENTVPAAPATQPEASPPPAAPPPSAPATVTTQIADPPAAGAAATTATPDEAIVAAMVDVEETVVDITDAPGGILNGEEVQPDGEDKQATPSPPPGTS